MLKVATVLPHEPYREYKDVERVYSGSTEIDKILDKNGNVLFAVNKEVEGTPPLTYKGKEDTNLKSYRIYGQTVDGESVGDRTENLFDKNDPDILDGYEIRETSIVMRQSYFVTNFISVNAETSYITNSADKGGFGTGVLEYDSSKQLVRRNSNASFNGFTTTNTTAYIKLNGKIEAKDTCMLVKGNTAPSIYEPYGYKVPVTVEGKNLLPNTATSQTINGVTFTVNEDGSVTCNGTATALTMLKVNTILTLPVGEFILTGSPTGGSWNASYYLYVQTDNISPQKFYNDIGNGKTINNTSADTVYSTRIVIERNYTINNLTFYPMIRKADIEDDTYEPYHAPVTTPIYLPEPIKMVGDEAEYIDYREQKQHRVRKNLLPNTATSQTINGVTFTVNEDGSITCNGTASENIFYRIGAAPMCNCTLNGCPPHDNLNSCLLRIITDETSKVLCTDNGSGANANVTIKSRCEIRLAQGYTFENLTFYPMIRKADIEDDTYEPYIEDTELDVTLPALPTLSGTNTLSVGTEVQPSNVYLKGRIKEIT